MSRKQLSAKERLTRQAKGQEIDRVPTLGGWMGGVRNLSALAGITVEEYLANPRAGVFKANKALDVDGMVYPVIPMQLEEIRTGAVLDEKFAGVEPEALQEHADAIPDTEKGVMATFDPVAAEGFYREYFDSFLRDSDGIVPIPNFWEIGGQFALYNEFGYSAFLTACALYPEALGKIWWARSLHAKEKAKILIKLYKEYDFVPLMFCGEDLCNNKGPMVSPVFLREQYFPSVKMVLDPLVDAGIRIIHHCDGDIRPVLDDFISIGFSGLQGFQYELGIDPYELRKLRSRLGEELLFFTGLSVTRTLPFGSEKDVKEEVDYFLDFTDGGKGMFLFTTNVTGVEVPPANIRAAYRYVKEWECGRKRLPKHRQWPWGQKPEGTAPLQIQQSA